MWPYSIFCPAHASMPTRKKSYKHIMLSSQQRNTKKSKLCSCKHPNAFAFLVQPCINPRCNKAVCLLITKPGEGTDLFLCHLPPVGQWQCLPAVWSASWRIILNEQTEDPVLKPPQSLQHKCSYGCQKKIIDCSHS